MPIQYAMQQIGTRSEPFSPTDFQLTETNTDTELEPQIVCGAMKNKSKAFITELKMPLTKNGH